MGKKVFDSLNRLVSRLFPSFSRSSGGENELNDVQKTAVFFLSLPPDASARLIGTLSSNEIRNITLEMSQLTSIAHTAQKEVIREFCGFLLEEGKVPHGTQPTKEIVHYIADRDPKGIMGILRRHWLTPKLPQPVQKEQKDLAERIKPEERAAIILSHIPHTLVKKILPQLSQDELIRVGRGMLESASILDVIQQQVWNSLSRWFRGSLDDQESILKGLHLLLQDEGLPEYPPPPDYPEKTIFLLRLLKPKEKEIGKKLMECLDRPEQELFLLTLRQPPPDLPEKEKKQIVEEFFGFIKSSFATRETIGEEALLEEAERIGLHRPKEVAECLESLWLSRKNNVSEWRELAEKHPLFCAQKLAAFMQLKGKKWETFGPAEKCAIFLKLIHPEIRSEVLKYVSEKNHHHLSFEMGKPKIITIGEKRSVLQEFIGQYYFQSTARLLESGSGN